MRTSTLRDTDQGRFRFDGLEPGSWLLTLHAPGFGSATAWARVEAGQIAELGKLRAAAGSWLEVAVVDAFDRPLPGVRVSAFLPGAPGEHSLEAGSGRRPGRVVHGNRVELPTARTNAEGLCRLSGLAPGSWTVQAEHPEYANGRSKPLLLIPGEGRRTSLRLTPGGSLTVLVIDRHGRARADVPVELLGPNFGWGFGDQRLERTDHQGAARYLRLTPGLYHARLRRTLPVGTGSLRLDPRAHDRRRDAAIHVHEGEAATLRLSEPALWTLRGRVTRGQAPVAGAVVALGTLGFPSLACEVQTRTSANGAWRLEGIPAGPIRLTWSLPGARFPASRSLDLDGEGGEWDGDLPLATGVIEGLVHDATGAPAPGVFLFLGAQRSLGSTARLTESTRTDAQGRFQFQDLPPGLWIVHTAPSHGPTSVRVDLGEDGVERVQIRL